MAGGGGGGGGGGICTRLRYYNMAASGLGWHWAGHFCPPLGNTLLAIIYRDSISGSETYFLSLCWHSLAESRD